MAVNLLELLSQRMGLILEGEQLSADVGLRSSGEYYTAGRWPGG
jgi:hypothetical protein